MRTVASFLLICMLCSAGLVLAESQEKPDMLCLRIVFDPVEDKVEINDLYNFLSRMMTPTFALVTAEYRATLNVPRHDAGWILYDSMRTQPPENVVLRKFVAVRESEVSPSAEDDVPGKSFLGYSAWEYWMRYPDRDGALTLLKVFSIRDRHLNPKDSFVDISIDASSSHDAFSSQWDRAMGELHRVVDAADKFMTICEPYPAIPEE